MERSFNGEHPESSEIKQEVLQELLVRFRDIAVLKGAEIDTGLEPPTNENDLEIIPLILEMAQEDLPDSLSKQGEAEQLKVVYEPQGIIDDNFYGEQVSIEINEKNGLTRSIGLVKEQDGELASWSSINITNDQIDSVENTDLTREERHEILARLLLRDELLELLNAEGPAGDYARSLHSEFAELEVSKVNMNDVILLQRILSELESQ